MHEQNVPWDDVRELRVFKRIQRKRSERTGISGPRFWRVTAGIGIAAAATLTIVVLDRMPNPMTDRNAKAPIRRMADNARTEPRNADLKEAQNTSILALNDAGHVILTAGAQVSVLTQSSQLLELEQAQGRARYEITHRQGHEVVVRAAGIEIRVVGTVFDVSIEESLVHVQVEQGVVRINDGQRVVELLAGERMAVSRPQGCAAGAIAKTDARGERSAADGPSIDKLFKEMDDARSKGDLSRAADLLGEIIARKDSVSSMADAQFILGKVERARGRHQEAALAFRSCQKLLPGSPLYEDALAEEAIAWAAANRMEQAKEAATAYLRAYPHGIHALRMSGIVE